MADHDRITQPIANLSKADRRTAISIVPDAAVVGPASPADARRRAVRPSHRLCGRLAASAAAIVPARRTDAIACRVPEDKPVSKAAAIAAGPRAHHLAGGCAAHRPRKTQRAAAIVAR